MAKRVLDIVIKLSKQGGADKETITSLVKVKSALLDAAAVAGTFVAAGYAIKTVLDQTVGKHIAYAAEVRRAADATGMTTEETSKLIQVLDDVKIEYSALEKVIQKNGDTMDFTTAGLAKMSGEYLALSDANAQAAFMQERFGKQWISFVPLMKLGENSISSMGAAVNENLVITDKAAKEVREYEIAQDNLNDTWSAFTNSVAPPMMNALTDLMNASLDYSRAQEILDEEGITYSRNRNAALQAALAQAAAEREAANAMLLGADATGHAARATDDWWASTKQLNTELEDTAALEAEWKNEADSLLSTALSLKRADEDYITTLADLDAQLADNKISTDEYKTGVDAAKAAHEAATNQIIIDIVKMQLAADGWQQSDTTAMFTILENLGALSAAERSHAEETTVNAQAMADAYARVGSVSTDQQPIVTAALKAIDDQLQKGRLTTMQYKQKVDALYSSIEHLNGLEATAVVNLIVNGSVPNFAGQTSRGAFKMRAGGGPLDGDITAVGEKGYELIARGKNGKYTVIPHEASMWMVAAGLVPDRGLAGGGALDALHSTGLPGSISSPTVISQTSLSTAEMQSELRNLNSQMRGLRHELPTALAAALARSI